MYDKKFWNERYTRDEYLYGTEPNSFLVENFGLLTGPVLSLSEGEGRNAVFLAGRGLKVHGVDISEVALTKARALAKSKDVEIQTEVADLAKFEPKKNSMAQLFLFLLIFQVQLDIGCTHWSSNA